jgi:hypothetical protein
MSHARLFVIGWTLSLSISALFFGICFRFLLPLSIIRTTLLGHLITFTTPSVIDHRHSTRSFDHSHYTTRRHIDYRRTLYSCHTTTTHAHSLATHTLFLGTTTIPLSLPPPLHGHPYHNQASLARYPSHHIYPPFRLGQFCT